MLPEELQTRFARFDRYSLEELGLSILWTHALKNLVGDDGRVDLTGTVLGDAAQDELSSWATNELKSLTPRMAAHHCVAMWAALEALVEDIFVIRLRLDPAHLEHERLGRQKVRLADFLTMDEDESYRTLARSVEASHSHGQPEAYEVLLDCVQLSGPIDENARLTLIELEQVRNVLVHRNGIVDEKLARATHLLEVEIGEELSVAGDNHLRYHRACHTYAQTIRLRAEARYDELAYPPDPVLMDTNEPLEDADIEGIEE